VTHFVSASCKGEYCKQQYYNWTWEEMETCYSPATHKVAEEIPNDDPMPYRHELTQYLCCRHFSSLMRNDCGGVK